MSPEQAAERRPSKEEIHAALDGWNGEADTSPLKDLYLVREVEQRGFTLRGATNHVLEEILTVLHPKHQLEMDVLRLRFIEGDTGQVAAHKLHIAPSTLFLKQRQALGYLTDELVRMEQQARSGQRFVLENRLDPLVAHRLVGVQPLMSELQAILRLPAPPWLIALVGIGGIGKTTLADALTRHLIAETVFDDVAWTSTRQHTFNLAGTTQPVPQPLLNVEAVLEAIAGQLLGRAIAATLRSSDELFQSLQERLRKRPHLIVIDNLESLSDVEQLLPTLRRLAGPTKFLLTSRDSYHAEGDLYPFVVPELSESDALTLLQQEVQDRHILQGAGADAMLRQIYGVVGGNPLALRLVIGQASLHDLDPILSDLKNSTGAAEKLYTHIFRRAWDALEEPARHLLLAMPLLPPRGGSADQLEQISGLPVGEFRTALELLVRLNLLDQRGHLGQYLYTIHHLTRSFLHERVTRWS